MMQIHLTGDKLPADLLAVLPADEAAGTCEVLARKSAYAIYAMQGEKPVFYAVIDIDQGGVIAAHYVRTFVPVMGPMLAKQLFGAAQVSGRPIRVHSDTLERAKAMARVAGAKLICEAKDADGIPHGVFA